MIELRCPGYRANLMAKISEGSTDTFLRIETQCRSCESDLRKDGIRARVLHVYNVRGEMVNNKIEPKP